MYRIPQTSNFGRTDRPQNLNKPVQNIRKNAKFVTNYLGSRSCSLRVPASRPAIGRHNKRRTTNHVGLAPLIPLIPLLLLSSVMTSPTPPSGNTNTAFSRRFNRAQNISAQPSVNTDTEKKSESFHPPLQHKRLATPRRPPAPDICHRCRPRSKNDLGPIATMTPTSDQAPPPPAGESFFADLTRMLLQTPADPVVSPGKTSTSFLIPGAEPSPSFGLMGKAWKIITEGRIEERRIARERDNAEKIFYGRFKVNPFSATYSAFFDEALGILFEDEGLEKNAIYQSVRGVFFDVRHIHAPVAYLLPRQQMPIAYSHSWSIKEIAAGMHFFLIAEKAGLITAQAGDITFSWPDNISPRIQNLLTNGWLWRTFTRFMTLRLASGPIYEAARKEIKANLSAQFARTFSDVPADSNARLNNFLNNCREVKYKRMTVAGMIMTPPTQENTNGVLYFMNSDLAPVIVTESTFRLDDPRIREAVKNGLPLKKVTEMGDKLFEKHWSVPPLHAMWSPSLAFAKSDTAVNIIWNTAVEKFADDMNLAVFSSGEKAAMFALGMTQTAMKALLVVGAAPAGPILSFITGILITLPDAGMALVADSPTTSEEYRRNFLVGLAIEMVGLGFFLGHKSIIHTQAAKIARRLNARPMTKEAEEFALTEWATNFKTFMELPPNEKFAYLALSAVTEPYGRLSQRLTHNAMSWDVVGRLEYSAGLLTKVSLDELSAHTTAQNFALFLGSSPMLIASKPEFIALPRGSRIAFIGQQKEIKHALAKLDNGVALGYRNEFIGADRNMIEAFDIADAFKWGADGYVNIIEGGEKFIILARPTPVWPYDEKTPAMQAEKPPHITRFTGALWVRMTTGRNIRPSGQADLPSVLDDDVLTSEINLQPATNQLTEAEIDFGKIVEVADHRCQAQCEEEKIEDTRSMLLAKIFNFSTLSAIELRDHCDAAVHTALTKISLYKPEVEWESLPLVARKMVDIKFKLRDQGKGWSRSDRLKLAYDSYLLPPDPASFDRIYYELHQALMAEQKQDTDTINAMRASPSSVLLTYLLIDSPEKISVFLSNFKETTHTETSPPAIDHLSPSIIKSLWRYSAQQASAFLYSFEFSNLLFPGSFDRVAWLYDYLTQKNSGRANTFDAENGLAQKRATLIRALGFEQAKPELASAVLRALGFNGMTLAGSYGLNVRDLSSRPELHSVIGMSAFTYREKRELLEEVRSQTGFSQHYTIGTPEAAVDKMLTLFPGGKGLLTVAHGRNVDVLFNQLITLQLALENGVSRPDLKKLEALWTNLLAHRPLVEGLTAWTDDLIQKYPVMTMDGMIEASNALYNIAKYPRPPSDSGHDPIAPALLQFAKRMVRNEIRAPVMGGSSHASTTLIMHKFLERYIGNTSVPTSIRGWADWLTLRASHQVHAEENATTPPHQRYVNAVRAYAIQWMGPSATWPDLPALFENPVDDIALRFGPPEERLLDDIGILARSNFRNLNTTRNNVPFNIIRTAIEGIVTSAFKLHGADYNDNFLYDQDFLFPQLLARDGITGDFFSNKCPKGTQGATLVVGGRPMSAVPSLSLLLKIKDDLTDFSNRNGSAIFDKLFAIKAEDIAITKTDARALFTFFYDNSWTYRAIVNAASLDGEVWTIIYGQSPHLKTRSKNFCVPWDHQFQHLPKHVDLAGIPQEPYAAQLYIELWLHLFLQQKEPLYENKYEQGPAIMLANIILQQVGLLQYEHWSYHQSPSPVALSLRLHQARITAWENRVAIEILSEIAPPSIRLAAFSYQAEESITVKPMLARLALLPRAPYVETLFSTMRITATKNSNQYRDNFLKIFRTLFATKGIFAQLMTLYGDRISAGPAWHLVSVDRVASPDILHRFGASHRVDHARRTVYFADPTLFPSVYLTMNGPVPMSFKRLVIHIGIEILLAVPVLDDAYVCENRGEIIPFVDWALKEANHKSPSATSGAITDPSDHSVTVRMQKNILSICRKVHDENTALSDQFWAHYRFATE